MKDGINENELEVITCGIIDQRYGQALEGTHHAVYRGRTLCGQNGSERETRSTIWFSLSRMHDAEEEVTCKACRRALQLSKRHGSSRELL